ncbi:MAG: carboxymuconolactone decarboxylase family protein [Gammaproteobacteria bacterium]
MSRIPLVERENAGPEVSALFDRADSLGFSLFNVFKLWANNAQAAAGLINIAEALYGNNKLSARYRELAYLRASQVNSCHY